MQSLPCTNARRLARWWSHNAISLLIASAQRFEEAPDQKPAGEATSKKWWSHKAISLPERVRIALRRSAGPKPAGEAIPKGMVEPDGIEPTTSSLQS
jgi:hypothetical protein